MVGGGFFPAGRQIGGDGEGKRRTGEDARVNREWGRMKLVHSVQTESQPRAQPSSERGPQFLFDRPARDLPLARSNVTVWAGHFESMRSRLCESFSQHDPFGLLPDPPAVFMR